MKFWRIKLSLFLNYFLFAILLNSVGTVILQVQRNFDVSETAASVLEACKDLSIAMVSFVVASSVARFGYRRAMLAALAAIAVVCAAMPSLDSFLATKLLFVATGACFAVIKVSVFATIGLVTEDRKDHASFMSFLESFFMIGILSAYFLFGAFVGDSPAASTEWFRVYYVLAIVAAAAFMLSLGAPLDESKVHAEAAGSIAAGFVEMLRLAWTPLSLVFIVSVFTYVMVEQGIMSWLPTFNNRILHLPASLSIEMASILAASTALGRFIAGWALRRLRWYVVVFFCLLCAGVLVLLAMPLAARIDPDAVVTSWGNAPLAAFIFPLIGFFIAPVYPVINSAILSALPPVKHGAMCGLIVIFSALGGTSGSMITGYVFGAYGGQRAFYLSLVPIAALIGTLFLFDRLLSASSRAATATDAAASSTQ